MFDLHCHTYYSDGRFAPADVVTAAARKGLRVLAITDHDNTRGVREALAYRQGAGRELLDGLEIIPAIELTTCWPGIGLPPGDANVDLLGYFIDLDNAGFLAYEQASLKEIETRIAHCCALLTEMGYPLSIEEVLAENPRYAGALQAIHALEHKGLAPGWNAAVELFSRVWDMDVQNEFTIHNAIRQIHQAGGVAVLAHPTIVRPYGRWLTAAHLRELVDAGLDGIEIYHKRLDEPARAYFLRLANELGLLVTGGSDTHGWYRGFDELASQPVTEEMVEGLRGKKR